MGKMECGSFSLGAYLSLCLVVHLKHYQVPYRCLFSYSLSLSNHHDFFSFLVCSDEYILPKIAERDLWRFANLRSTSSNLGIHLPLHEVRLSFWLWIP